MAKARNVWQQRWTRDSGPGEKTGEQRVAPSIKAAWQRANWNGSHCNYRSCRNRTEHTNRSSSIKRIGVFLDHHHTQAEEIPARLGPLAIYNWISAAGHSFEYDKFGRNRTQVEKWNDPDPELSIFVAINNEFSMSIATWPSCIIPRLQPVIFLVHFFSLFLRLQCIFSSCR